MGLRKAKGLEWQLVFPDGKKRTVTLPRITARVARRAEKIKYEYVELRGNIEGDEETLKKLDELIAEVCTFYDDLTLDDIYDGLEAKQLDDFVWDTCDYIVDGTVGRLEALREKQISASGEEVRQGATANK
jgi:hypothetical protein